MKKELQKLATMMLLSMMWPQLTSGQTQVANHDASSNQASKAPETTTIYQLTDQLEAGGARGPFVRVQALCARCPLYLRPDEGLRRFRHQESYVPADSGLQD